MIQTRTIQFAKEADDVLIFVIELIKDLKAKKGLPEIAAENLPNLMQAMSGLDQIEGETSADRTVVAQTVGYRIGELTTALLG